MNESEFLLDVLQTNVCFPAKPSSHKRGTFDLRLDEWNATPPYYVDISNVKEESILIKVDEKIFDTTNFFDSTKCNGISKKADFILISPQEKKVIFIELTQQDKTGKSNTDIKHQLMGLCSFFHYLKSIIKYYKPYSSHLPLIPFEKYELKYIAIRMLSNKRKQVRPNVKSSKHNSVENFKTIKAEKNSIPYMYIR